MTTRQRLIENDCRDKLGWDTLKISFATEKEMTSALVSWEKNKTKKVQTMQNIESHIPLVVRNDCQVLHNTLPFTGKLTVRQLKDIITRKEHFIKSDDIMDDDIQLILTGIEQDKTLLREELMLIEKKTKLLQTIKHKRITTREFLLLSQTPHDILHVNTINKKLEELEVELENLRSL